MFFAQSSVGFELQNSHDFEKHSTERGGSRPKEPFFCFLHQNLSWQAHIKAISSKIAKSTGIIIKSRQFFLSNTLCTLYNSLILPYLQYCSIIWASTYSSHLQPLFRLQKKALRIITHSPPGAHTYSLFNKFKILNIFNVYKYRVSCFVFLHMQKLLPSPLSSLFVLNSDCHQYLTRQKKQLTSLYS